MKADIITEFMRNHNIEKLFPWQNEAVLAGLLSGISMVFDWPTGTGKSLIAELAVLKNVSEGKKCIYVLPWVAPATERARSIYVGASKLGLDPSILLAAKKLKLVKRTLVDLEKLPNSFDVLVSTTEFLDKILRNKETYLKNIELIVIDEVHILNEPRRGAVADKVFGWLFSLNPDSQKICMSATIANPETVSLWLDAKTISVSERPIPLARGVMSLESNSFVWDIPIGDGIFKLDFIPKTKRGACFALAEKTLNSVNEKGVLRQSIVFLNSRPMVYSWAQKFSQFLYSRGYEYIVPKEDVDSKSKEIVNAPVERRILHLLRYGIGVHTGGESFESRILVEQLFRDRMIHTIFCTSTLSMGLNLPATIVLVPYTQFRAGVFISRVLASQTIGRAGRYEYGDAMGYGLFIARTDSEKDMIWNRYIVSPIEPIQSTLHPSHENDAFETQILSLFSSSRNDMYLEALHHSYAEHSSIETANAVDHTVSQLCNSGFLERKNSNYVLTDLGISANANFINVRSAEHIYRKIANILKVPPADRFESLVDEILSCLCYLPKSISIFDENRLDRFTIYELLRRRILGSSNKYTLKVIARRIRQDIGAKDIDDILDHTMRHLDFIIALFDDSRLKDIRSGLSLGLNPMMFWLLSTTDYKEIKRARRWIEQLRNSSVASYDAETISKLSQSILVSLGISPKDANSILTRADFALRSRKITHQDL